MASSEAGPSRPRPVIANASSLASASGSSSSGGSRSSANAATSNGTASSSGAQQPEPQRRARPRITGQGGGSTILVNSSQRGNPLLQGIKNIGWEYGDIVPDYQVGVSAGVLFLSLRYHRLHPEYVHKRIGLLGNMYTLRILLVQCDVNDHQPAVKELSKVALINNLTIMMAWSPEEAAKYIETFKMYENKSPSVIQERISDDYQSQLTAVLTSVPRINKTDVLTLSSNLGSLKRISQTDAETLSMLPGFAETKIKRLREAFTQPFRAGMGAPGSGLKTMRQRKAAAALLAAERGEELPDALNVLDRPDEDGPSLQGAREVLDDPTRSARDEDGARQAPMQGIQPPPQPSRPLNGSRAAPIAEPPRQDASARPEGQSSSSGLTGALAAAARLREGGWRKNATTARSMLDTGIEAAGSTAGPPPGGATAVPAEPVAAAPAATDKGSADDAQLWEGMSSDPLLEDFENLTEEEQLAMALKMSTGEA